MVVIYWHVVAIQEPMVSRGNQYITLMLEVVLMQELRVKEVSATHRAGKVGLLPSTGTNVFQQTLLASKHLHQHIDRNK